MTHFLWSVLLEAMTRGERVTRPKRKSEYSIYFGSSQAQRGWEALRAVRSSDLVEAWEHLTRNPESLTPLSYPLKGALSTVVKNGVEHTRWQLKLSKTQGSRIWYYVENQEVHIEVVHTNHPGETS